MQNLRDYLNSLLPPDQVSFARRCGTTIGYMRKAISTGQLFRADVTIAIDRESSGAVRCESVRPDVDWAYVASRPAAVAPAGQVA